MAGISVYRVYQDHKTGYLVGSTHVECLSCGVPRVIPPPARCTCGGFYRMGDYWHHNGTRYETYINGQSRVIFPLIDLQKNPSVVSMQYKYGFGYCYGQ